MILIYAFTYKLKHLFLNNFAITTDFFYYLCRMQAQKSQKWYNNDAVMKLERKITRDWFSRAPPTCRLQSTLLTAEM